jgi:hypothetical protein
MLRKSGIRSSQKFSELEVEACHFKEFKGEKTCPLKMSNFVHMNSMSHTKLECHYSVCPLNESGSTRNRYSLKPVSNTGE